LGTCEKRETRGPERSVCERGSRGEALLNRVCGRKLEWGGGKEQAKTIRWKMGGTCCGWGVAGGTSFGGGASRVLGVIFRNQGVGGAHGGWGGVPAIQICKDHQARKKKGDRGRRRGGKMPNDILSCKKGRQGGERGMKRNWVCFCRSSRETESSLRRIVKNCLRTDRRRRGGEKGTRGDRRTPEGNGKRGGSSKTLRGKKANQAALKKGGDEQKLSRFVRGESVSIVWSTKRNRRRCG